MCGLGHLASMTFSWLLAWQIGNFGGLQYSASRPCDAARTGSIKAWSRIYFISINVIEINFRLALTSVVCVAEKYYYRLQWANRSRKKEME